MKNLGTFNRFKLQRVETKSISGGVHEDYCNTLIMVMQSRFNEGDSDGLAAAGAAWDAHCGD